MKKTASLAILVLLVLGLILLSLIADGAIMGHWKQLPFLIWQFRLPRLIVLLLAAVSLGVSGLIAQLVLANPLADSSTLGLQSGASFGIASFVVLGTHLGAGLWWASGVMISGFIGCLIAFGLLYVLVVKKGFRTQQLIVSGLAITSFFQACLILLQLLSSPFDFMKLAIWLTGDIWQTQPVLVFVMGLILVICLVAVSFFSKRLLILGLADEQVASLGVDLPNTRFKLLLILLILTVVNVGLVGGLGFVGLLAVHLMRRFSVGNLRLRFVYVSLLATILLLTSELLGRYVIYPSYLPLGFVLALVACPYLIYMILKDNHL